MARALQSVAPEDIVIIGLDTDHGEEHPLYDERIHLEVDENLMRNILSFGVKHPVLVRQEAGRFFCVDGRQRVRASREASKLASSVGDYPIQVPILVEQGGDDRIMSIMIGVNVHRRDDDILTLAAKARRLMDRLQGDMDQACLTFGKSKTTIKSWLRLDAAPEEVKTALRENKISAGSAYEITRLDSREQQLELLEKLTRGMDGRVPESAAKKARQEMDGSSASDSTQAHAAPGTSDVPSADEGVLGDAQPSKGSTKGSSTRKKAKQEGVKRTWLRRALKTKAADALTEDQVKVLRWFAHGEQENGDWFDTFQFDAEAEMEGE